MAEQRLVAAFYLSAPVRPSPLELQKLAEKARVEVVRVPRWGPPEVSPVLGRWDGLDCEVRLLPLAYYDVLVVTFRQDEFRARWSGTDPLPHEARLTLNAFVATCASLLPASALLTSYAWGDPAKYLAELEDRILGGDVANLAREHVWLLYVTSEDVDLLKAFAPAEATELIRVSGGGAVLVRELDRDHW